MILALTFIILGVWAFVFFPMVRSGDRKQKQDSKADKEAERLERKESNEAALGELEFDYRTGKLTEEDYTRLLDIYKKESVKAARALDKKSSGRGNGPKKVKVSTVYCTECGSPSDPKSKYCSQCGTSLSRRSD